MSAAAVAWDQLAMELASAAASFNSVTSGLVGESWLGPSSAAMAAAVAPYLGWLAAAAAQAQRSATQAAALVAEFEAVRAAMVQPALVAANRSDLVSLVFSNFFGQNAPAIAAIEAAYEQMWAIDVSVMSAYHAGASAVASALTPFTAPPQNLTDLPAQLAAAPAAVVTAAITSSKGVLANLSLGLANSGFGQMGAANLGILNLGSLNPGGNNFGLGNVGSNNVGLGNTGNGNIGFGNTGNGNIGFGLTGDNQQGFGGWNSGTGNIGLFNSGTGNIGIGNTGTGNFGIGNSGTSYNTGIGNTGQANTGFFNAGIANTGIGNTGNYNTGSFNLGSFNTGDFNTGSSNTGFFNPGNLNTGVGNTGNVNTGGFNSGNYSNGFFWRGDYQGLIGFSGTLTIPAAGLDLNGLGSVGPITIPSITIPEIGLGINSSGALVGPINVPPITVPAIGLGVSSSGALVGPINVPPITVPAIGLGVSSSGALVGPINVPPITVPAIGLGVSSSGALVGPINVPPITVPAIGLGINSTGALVGPINIPPITLNSIGLELSAFQVINVGSISIPASPLAIGLFGVNPTVGSIGPGSISIQLGTPEIPAIPPFFPGFPPDYVTVSGQIGPITFLSGGYSLPAIPLGIDVGGGLGPFTVFPDGYSLPAIPLGIDVGGGLGPFTVFPDGYSLPAIPLGIDVGGGLGPFTVPAIVVPPVAAPNVLAGVLEHDNDGSGAAVLAALAKLATAVAAQLVAGGLTIIGITGSSGKTSTKDLMAAVLAPLGEVVAPPGSFNNELGHPWTVLRATRRTDYLILEMAARHHGNIAALAEIAPPSIGVVLNVGTAHLGEFGSREVIAQTKAELPQAVPHSGAVVLNADDPAVAAMAKLTAARVVRVSRDNTGDVWAGPVSLDELARPRFTLHAHDAQAEVRLGVCGDHQVTNALCAAAVALECGASVEQVAAALTAAPPVSRHRMQVTTRGDGVTVIDDAYNANPDSMRAGLQALAWIAHQPEATRRSWAVLGEMAELGEDAIAEHDRIGRLAVRLDVSRLVVVGTGRSISAMHHGAVLEGAWGSGEATADHGADRTAVNVADGDAALALLRAELRPGDVVLVKASNAAGLGAVADALVADDTCGSVRP